MRGVYNFHISNVNMKHFNKLLKAQVKYMPCSKMKVKTIACFNRFNKLIINRSIYEGNKVSNKVRCPEVDFP